MPQKPAPFSAIIRLWAMLRAFSVLAVALRFGLDEFVCARGRPRWFWAFWRATIGRRKFALPPPQRLRAALERLGPLFVKFGQAISTRRDMLPADLADELAKLQERVPPESPAAIRASLERAFEKPLAQIFAEFDDAPVGSASVAQVHRAVLHDGREVAVKVLRPNVRRAVARDIALLRRVARVVEWLLPDGKRLRPGAVVDEFHRHLKIETDLLLEAANCAQLRRNLAADPRARVPKVHWDFCAREAMVMEFLRGIPVSQTEALAAAGINLRRLARDGIEIFFAQVFGDRFFHADMHPGNIHVDAQGRFIFYDFGIMGRLTPFDQDYLARNFLAFFNRDYRRVAEMHAQAGWTPPDTPIDEFENAIRATCEPVFSKPLGEISFGKFLLDMFRTARAFRLEVQPQLFLLQKTMLSIEGVGRELDPQINIWDTAKPFLENWARKQYGPARALRVVRRQLPDWLSLLDDLPAVVRAAAASGRETERLKIEIAALKKRGRITTALALVAAVAIAVAAGWLWAGR